MGLSWASRQTDWAEEGMEELGQKAPVSRRCHCCLVSKRESRMGFCVQQMQRGGCGGLFPGLDGERALGEEMTA